MKYIFETIRKAVDKTIISKRMLSHKMLNKSHQFEHFVYRSGEVTPSLMNYERNLFTPDKHQNASHTNF